MTAVTLPGQLELATVIDRKTQQDGISSRTANSGFPGQAQANPWTAQDKGVQIAKLLRSYEERPTSETWSRIQALAAEILR